jgi:hypothetical protein
MTSDECENISDSLSRKRKQGLSSNVAEFVSSMTFAKKKAVSFSGITTTSNYYYDTDPCYCGDDECEALERSLPVEIAEAVRNYKLLRQDHPYNPSTTNNDTCADTTNKFAIPLMFHPNKPRQERKLLATIQSSNIAIWKLIMPCDAEPLIESGGTHRIVYVRHLPENSNIISIGRGIYGSSMEEKGRVLMNWKDRGWYLLPSNGGISLGWIHKHYTTATQNNNDTFGTSDTSNGTTSTNDADGENDIKNDEDSNIPSKDAAIVIVVKLSIPVTSGYDKTTNDEKQDNKNVERPFFNVLTTYLQTAKTTQDLSATPPSEQQQSTSVEEELGRHGGITIADQDHPKLLEALFQLIHL